jgi:hypothetical protein
MAIYLFRSNDNDIFNITSIAAIHTTIRGDEDPLDRAGPAGPSMKTLEKPNHRSLTLAVRKEVVTEPRP